jgi:dTDP-4-dehydrorhamnose 3,5-epimerase
MNITETQFAGLYVIERLIYEDERGSLDRLFCDKDLQRVLGLRKIRQVNHTRTYKQGVIRGLHYQRPPSTELKVVSCIKGKIFDVAVDLREGSKTFLTYYSKILTEENPQSVVIPEGFAHGFQALAADCHLLYLHTASYNQENYARVNALDPRIDIAWPQPITLRSKADELSPILGKDFRGIRVTSGN